MKNQNSPQLNGFIDSDQAAEFLKISKKYLYILVHQRKIPYYKPFGKMLLFKVGELEKYITAKRFQTHDEITAAAANYIARLDK